MTDSVSSCGDRLTTFEVTFPRFVLSEFNTHCMLSRNSASSRAIPVVKRLKEVIDDPFVPSAFGRNISGMQAVENLAGQVEDEAREIWMTGRDRAVSTALEMVFGVSETSRLVGRTATRETLSRVVAELTETDVEHGRLNVHKQIVNRVLEPYMWHTVIVTATDWSNFFALRTHSAAQPEIRAVALMMLRHYEEDAPKPVVESGWHLPMIQVDEQQAAKDDPEYWAKVSVARCARVSYLTHSGIRNVDRDIDLYERLIHDGHFSPLEHVGQAMTRNQRETSERSGKFRGWYQWRKRISNEDDYSRVLAERGDSPGWMSS